MVRTFEPLLIHLSKYWVLRAQLCLTVCNPWEVSIFKCQYLWIGYFQRLLCPWNFPGKNTGVSCCFFLQRIFPTQGLNPCLLILYHWATWEAPSKYWRSPSSQSYGFPSGHVWMWELGYKESWAPKNWCFWTVVLERSLENSLDCKEIQPVHPKGNQSWIFIGRTDAEAETPILWPPDAKNWLIGKDPDVGKDWRQEENEMTEDEMVGWHHHSILHSIFFVYNFSMSIRIDGYGLQVKKLFWLFSFFYI